MDIIIVCHTEFGFVDEKTKAVIYEKRAGKGAREGVSNLIKIAGKYKAKITFAVSPEVIDCFPKNTSHEIGLHIHPGWEEFKYKNFKWIVGDSFLKRNCVFNKTSTALADYNYQEQLEIISKGKEYFVKKLSYEPKVFVAGRWALNTDTIKALINLGFTHDCSAYPGLELNNSGWPKLKRISMPYMPDGNDYQSMGNLPFLIIPISRMPLGGMAGPEDIRKYGFSWLKACFSEYYNQGAPLFHIALHSPAMTDPYYIYFMDKFFSFVLKHKNINFKFASEIKEYPKKEIKENYLYYPFALNKTLAKFFLNKLYH
ncbi:MAG: PTS alpha-glucoside transporter subunit IIBC [Candidatus Staskawiczbacteria bacterium]|nr:PTS alpha-glucoside transporter subunit IIBC [Candidatus Staskawiczbacteria bacterium]